MRLDLCERTSLRCGDCRDGDWREGEDPSQLEENEVEVFILADEAPDCGGIAGMWWAWEGDLRAFGKGAIEARVDGWLLVSGCGRRKRKAGAKEEHVTYPRSDPRRIERRARASCLGTAVPGDD